MNYYEMLLARKLAKGELPPNAYLLKTASGSLVSFNDGADLPMPSFVCNISAVQDLHGQDHPWVGGAGKNKFFVNESVTSSDCIDSANATTGIISVADISTAKWSLPYIGYTDVISGKTYTISGGLLKYGRIGGSTEASGYPNDSNVPDVDIGTIIHSAITNGTASRTFTANTTQRIYWYYCTDTGLANHQAFNVQPIVVEGSSAGTWSPYSNICPISGHTGVDAVISPTTEASAGTTIAVNWQTDAGEVFGGYIDLVSGVLTVDKVGVDMGSLNYSYYHNDTRNDFYTTISSAITPIVGGDVKAICSVYERGAFHSLINGGFCISDSMLSSLQKIFLVRDFNYTDATTFKTAVTGQTLVYTLETPITYQLTSTQIKSLLGNNNAWCDTGDATLEYFGKGAE